MDEMKITSKFMTGLVSKIVNRALKKNGTDIDLDIVSILVKNDGIRTNVSIEGSIKTESIPKLLKGV